MKKIGILFTLTIISTTICPAQTYYDNGAIIENPTAFVLQGNSWDCFVITYMFLNGTADISGNNNTHITISAQFILFYRM